MSLHTWGSILGAGASIRLLPSGKTAGLHVETMLSAYCVICSLAAFELPEDDSSRFTSGALDSQAKAWTWGLPRCCHSKQNQ